MTREEALGLRGQIEEVQEKLAIASSTADDVEVQEFASNVELVLRVVLMMFSIFESGENIRSHASFMADKLWNGLSAYGLSTFICRRFGCNQEKQKLNS